MSWKNTQHEVIPQPMLDYGFEDINGNRWLDSMVDAYNQYSQEINEAKDKATQDYLLDNRHKFYVACLEEMKDYDPTPWCHWCGAMKISQCDCGPIADND